MRKESEPSKRNWDASIRCLKRGDHYLLVMWDMRPGLRATHLVGVGIAVFAVALSIGVKWLTYNVAPPNPDLLLGMFIALILAGVLFRRALGNAAGWLLDRTLFRFLEPKEDEKDSE